MSCAFCGAEYGVVGDTGGAREGLTADETLLLNSLAIGARGELWRRQVAVA